MGGPVRRARARRPWAFHHRFMIIGGVVPLMLIGWLV
jgi:hypothetical protein